VKGNQVAPAELEGHLLGHPDVIDAGVIGIPDEFSGEVPLAFVVLRPELVASVKDNSEVADDLRQRIFKARLYHQHHHNLIGIHYALMFSTFRRRNQNTNGRLAEYILLKQFPKMPVGKFCGVFSGTRPRLSLLTPSPFLVNSVILCTVIWV